MSFCRFLPVTTQLSRGHPQQKPCLGQRPACAAKALASLAEPKTVELPPPEPEPPAAPELPAIADLGPNESNFATAKKTRRARKTKRPCPVPVLKEAAWQGRGGEALFFHFAFFLPFFLCQASFFFASATVGDDR
jgi:hypothetical protein